MEVETKNLCSVVRIVLLQFFVLNIYQLQLPPSLTTTLSWNWDSKLPISSARRSVLLAESCDFWVRSPLQSSVSKKGKCLQISISEQALLRIWRMLLILIALLAKRWRRCSPMMFSDLMIPIVIMMMTMMQYPRGRTWSRILRTHLQCPHQCQLHHPLYQVHHLTLSFTYCFIGCCCCQDNSAQPCTIAGPGWWLLSPDSQSYCHWWDVRRCRHYVWRGGGRGYSCQT